MEEVRGREVLDSGDWDEEDEEEESEEAAHLRARRSREALLERFSRYEAAAAFLQREAERRQFAETAGDMAQLRLRLRQGPVRLLIVGVSCSGKSTLVNALTGSFVAPEGATATSCIPLWVTGREPDAHAPGVRFRRLTLKNGVFSGKTCNRGVALNQLCHAPGEKADVPEGMVAVTAEAGGGLLWESGLTLVDTPGLGQQLADDEWTERAVALKAELLLIAHGANEKILGEEFQTLFPGGQRDLGLDMQKDLFLLGNNIHSTRQGVCQTLGKLVADWGVVAEKHFYWINVWEQRLRIGYYRYYEWFPDGATDERSSREKEAEDRENWELFRQARDAARASGGGEEAEAENFARLRTQKFMEEAPSEEKREEIRKYGAVRIKQAKESWGDMRRLCRDLTARAWELYREPDRICDPIEQRLQKAADVLSACYAGCAAEKEEQIRAETARISPQELIGHANALERRELDALDALRGELVSRSGGIAAQLERLEKDARRALERYGQHLCARVQQTCGKASYSLAEKLPPLQDSLLQAGDWEEKIVQPVRSMYRESRESARLALLRQDESLLEGLEADVVAALAGGQRKKLLEEIRSALEYAARECPELALRGRVELPVFCPPRDVKAFRSDEPRPIGDCAGKLAEELSGRLAARGGRPWRTAEAAGMALGFAGWLAVKTAKTLTNILSDNTEDIVNKAMGKIDEDIAADAAAYVSNCVQPRIDGELGALRTAYEELEALLPRLEQLRGERSAALLEKIRERIFKARREVEALPLAREAEEFHKTLRSIYPEVLP